MTTKMESIPWTYTDGELIKTWEWRTNHFEAIIRADGSRYVWTVSHIAKAKIRTSLGRGQEISYIDAENAVREVVGKAYQPKWGYRVYAGSFATTFSIYSQESVDFGPYEGSRVTLKIKGENRIITVVGTLKVHNYDIILTPQTDQPMRIVPQQIISVEREFGGALDAPGGKGKSQNRTVTGTVSNGCTGMAGFIDDTVEHGVRDAWCPIHRV